MALGADPFEVNAAQQAVVVESKVVNATSSQSGDVGGKSVEIGKLALLYNSAKTSISRKFATHGSNILRHGHSIR